MYKRQATNSAFQDNFLKLEYYTCPYFVAINSGEKGPEAWKDARVRKALDLATNRDAMAVSYTHLSQIHRPL